MNSWTSIRLRIFTKKRQSNNKKQQPSNQRLRKTPCRLSGRTEGDSFRGAEVSSFRKI